MKKFGVREEFSIYIFLIFHIFIIYNWLNIFMNRLFPGLLPTAARFAFFKGLAGWLYSEREDFIVRLQLQVVPYSQRDTSYLIFSHRNNLQWLVNLSFNCVASNLYLTIKGTDTLTGTSKIKDLILATFQVACSLLTLSIIFILPTGDFSRTNEGI